MGHPRSKILAGRIHIYTGNGKGKTTAALGLAVRAAGHDKRVGIIFFDKGGNFYGEQVTLKKLKPRIHFWVTGLQRFEQGKPFRFTVTKQDKKEAMRGLRLATKLFQLRYDLVILDELITCVWLKMITQQDVIKIIKSKPQQVELVLTGRNCPARLFRYAHLVTEMKLRKHYFYNGIPARKGIEY